jgi:hypothetical protein
MFPRTPIVNSRPLKRGIDMFTIRDFALLLGAIISTASGPIPSQAQTTPPASRSDSVTIHLSLPKGSYAIGENPIVVMAVQNISSNEVCFSTDPYLRQIHVAGKNGEPPKTEFHRRLTGEFHPGDGPELMPGPVDCRPIAPGSVDSLKYDLTRFYDLSKPGDYSVYLEIYDPAGPKDGSGRWLRTNTVKFKMEAPTQ